MYLSLAELIERSVIDVDDAKRYMHCQLATGGVIDCKVGKK